MKFIIKGGYKFNIFVDSGVKINIINIKVMENADFEMQYTLKL